MVVTSLQAVEEDKKEEPATEEAKVAEATADAGKDTEMADADEKEIA